VLLKGVPVFNTLVRGEPPKLRTTKLGSQETRRIPLLYDVDILTEDYFVLSRSTRLTDRQTVGPLEELAVIELDAC